MNRMGENKSRTLWTLAVLALVVLIIAGCSNAPAGTGSSGDNKTAAPVETDSGSSDSNKTAAPTETGTGSTGNNAATTHEQGIKFAECMRKNGVSEFPDPDASGTFTIEQIANGSSLDTDSAAFKQAMTACKDLEPSGFTGNKRSPEHQAAALKFAQCIRDNGVKDFPDPAPDAPMIDTNKIPSANRSDGMTILHAAMQKCRDFAADAGVTGGQ